MMILRAVAGRLSNIVWGFHFSCLYASCRQGDFHAPLPAASVYNRLHLCGCVSGWLALVSFTYACSDGWSPPRVTRCCCSVAAACCCWASSGLVQREAQVHGMPMCTKEVGLVF